MEMMVPSPLNTAGGTLAPTPPPTAAVCPERRPPDHRHLPFLHRRSRGVAVTQATQSGLPPTSAQSTVRKTSPIRTFSSTPLRKDLPTRVDSGDGLRL